MKNRYFEIDNEIWPSFNGTEWAIKFAERNKNNPIVLFRLVFLKWIMLFYYGVQHELGKGEEIHDGDNSCVFCIAYDQEGCVDCPIAQYGNYAGCEDTPYMKFTESKMEWALEELVFLMKVYKKLKKVQPA